MKELNRIKKHRHLLKFLCLADKKQREVLMKSLNKDAVCCFSEICLNVQNGNLRLSKSEMVRVRKLKAVIRGLADSKLNISRKRVILAQKGGALISVVLPIVLAGLATYLSK